MAIPRLDALGDAGIAVVDGDGELRRRALEEKLAPVRSAADRAFLVRCLDDLYFTLDPLLRRHDRMAMAASIEMRVPFLENALIDFGIHLPLRAKFRRGQSKWVVKQAAEKLLPAEIVHARKRAFPMPADFDLGSEALLAGGAAGELLHWTDRTQQALIPLAAPPRGPALRAGGSRAVGTDLPARREARRAGERAARQLPRRQLHLEAAAASLARQIARVAAVVARDLAHQREAEAGPALGETAPADTTARRCARARPRERPARGPPRAACARPSAAGSHARLHG